MLLVRGERILNIQNDRINWGSHIPVLKSLFQTYNIKGAVELGMGYNSTPLLRENCEKVYSTENDLEWVELMKKEFGETENHRIEYHDISPCVKSTRRRSVGEPFLEKMRDYYLSIDTEGYDLLFVDGHSVTRLEAFLTIGDRFDFVVLHDVNEQGLINHYLTDMPQLLGYSRFVHKPFRQHTGLYMKEQYVSEIEKFESILQKETIDFGKRQSIFGKW